MSGLSGSPPDEEASLTYGTDIVSKVSHRDFASHASTSFLGLTTKRHLEAHPSPDCLQ